MRKGGPLGFIVLAGEIRSDILVPRYYDPTIDESLALLASTHDLVSVGELLERNQLLMSQGNYVGKMNYGTGDVPYIRTSDIANWELKGSPKHGVSTAILEKYRSRQDVQEGDLLLVHEGTYLIGTICPITRYDLRIVFQHHLAKLRPLPSQGGPRWSLLAALLLSPVVQRQIRARQLTADTIDSIVGRLPEVLLPFPKARLDAERVETKARRVFEGRAEERARLAKLFRELDSILVRGGVDDLGRIGNEEPSSYSPFVALLGDREPFAAYSMPGTAIRSDILVPKYYDPAIKRDLERYSANCDLISLRDLETDGVLSMAAGVEVGKLAYGTGKIPFVRTSDLGNWELKHDPKHSVSEEIYRDYEVQGDARPHDILVVRDGTYLVGTTALVQEQDLPLLYCGGLLRLRVMDHSQMDPYLLFALLNTQICRRQMGSKRFTRDIIDTLGKRLLEVVLPVPSSARVRLELSALVKRLLVSRAVLRQEAAELGNLVEGVG